MTLQEWLKLSGVSVRSFAKMLKVERAMVYRYFLGAIPRAGTIKRIEKITGGEVTAQDFYLNALQHRFVSERYVDRSIPDQMERRVPHLSW